MTNYSVAGRLSLHQISDHGIIIAENALKMAAIGLEISDMVSGHAACLGSLYDGRDNSGEQTAIERLRKYIFTSEVQICSAVSLGNVLGDRRVGKCGDGNGGSLFHLLVDGGGATVEGSAEYIGKAEYIVNLIWIVRTTCRKNEVIAAFHSLLVADLGVGVGKRKHYRSRSH